MKVDLSPAVVHSKYNGDKVLVDCIQVCVCVCVTLCVTLCLCVRRIYFGMCVFVFVCLSIVCARVCVCVCVCGWCAC